MKTFTNCAEKKAKQILNLLQGYTRGIRMTAILVLLLMGVSNAWGKTIYLCTSDINWAADGAVLFVWSWQDNNPGVATKMTSATTNLYKADINDSHNKIIFMRMKNGSDAISWDTNLWNRSQGDQGINDETPCFKLTAWGENSSKECSGKWGKISYDAHMYLDNSVANWTEAKKEFMIGHSSYSDTYTMTQISNTKLYYLAFSDIWHGYWDYGFIGVTSHWGPYEYQDITTRIKSAAKRTGTRGDQVLNGTKLFVPADANNDAVLTKTDLSGYSALNYTQTIKSAVKLAGKNYEEANSKATITVTSYKLTGNGTISTQQTASISTSAKSTTISAARTATTKLSVGTVATGYQFDGWYTAATDGTKLSTSTTYTYYPTEAKTVYARFSEITYSVQVKSADNNQGTISPANVNAGQFTGITITATPKVGFSFVNWTATDGITITNPNSASTTIKATKAGTVKAVFEESTFVVRGGVKFGDTWSKDTHVMTKKNASEKIVYYTITLDGTNNIDDESNSQFQFKIYEKERGKWYGLTADGDQYWYTRDMDAKSLDGNDATSKNIEIRADVKGNYEIKVDYSDPNSSPKITVTYPQKPYYLAGTWDNWVGESPIENKPVTIRLEKGNYSFKIFNYQTAAEYYGNHGEMTRNQSSGWTMTNGANDCQIYADLSGNYTFTFDKSTKKLTVTYPTAYKMTYGINNAKYGTVKAEVNYKSVESGEYWYPNTEFTFSYELTKGTLFKGWYDNANGTGEPLSTDPIYTHTLGADASVYAVCDDGYKITIGSVSYYFVDHNGQHLDSILIDFIQNTSFNAPLYKGETKADTGNGNYTAPVTGTYTCTINANKNGVIWTPPYKVGDYRLLYVDQVVEKGTGADSWKTVIRRTYEHPSDVVKKSATATRDVVSLHIFTKHENPEVILQQYQTVEDKDQWVDIEAHMVNGPLNALPGTAMLPGRKNAGEGSDCDDFVYDDGIEIIKADDTDAGCGVWDFTIVQNGETATLDLTSNGLKRYTGKYYIRTSSAPGQWSNYQIPENQITESHYASENFRQNNPEFVENEYFTHYFCKYVDKTKTANVKFIIANEHGIAISKEFTQDAFTTSGGDLAGENANVRFAWNQITNTCKRAYIAGSFDKTNEFLYVKPEDENKVTTKENTNGVKGYFNDNTNWLYYADVLAQPGAKVQVVAKYYGKYQYFMGEESGGSEFEKLIAGDENDKTNYPIRILYEFPEHRFVVAYMPPSTITGDVAIETPVMLIRKDHGEANQITFSDNEKKITAPLPAYGTITFTEGHLKDNNKTIYDKALYWISFPFDVQISDVFGFGKYGEDWIIEYYDGKRRSEVGLTYYNTFWEYNWNENFVMKAGQGYVLCLELDKVLTHFLDGENDSEEISLYFPSMENITWGDIKSQGQFPVEINEWKNNKTKEKDHNWNLIGVVSYANTGESTQQSNTNFLYEYVSATDTYTPRTSNGYNFKALHAYMVQYAGSITWTSHIAPKAIAAKENATSEDEIHRLSLDLIYNDKTLDQTFFQLEDGEATQMFDLNIDMTKIINSGANIYSISSDNNQLAGNVLPIQETVIPVGVVISAAGEYTFAMPDGTDGIVVELIDYETNTTTNMLLDEYTVNLGKGTFENRFALHVKPNKTTTSIVDVNTNTTGVKKYLIDGVLYMQKDGVLYDAQGKLVR